MQFTSFLITFRCSIISKLVPTVIFQFMNSPRRFFDSTNIPSSSAGGMSNSIGQLLSNSCPFTCHSVCNCQYKLSILSFQVLFRLMLWFTWGRNDKVLDFVYRNSVYSILDSMIFVLSISACNCLTLFLVLGSLVTGKASSSYQNEESWFHPG